jgi:hypothetical protein
MPLLVPLKLNANLFVNFTLPIPIHLTLLSASLAHGEQSAAFRALSLLIMLSSHLIVNSYRREIFVYPRMPMPLD